MIEIFKMVHKYYYDVSAAVKLNFIMFITTRNKYKL